MTQLLTQNKKMKASSTGSHVVYNFGIPAYKSDTGLVTCPMAGSCAKGCYARQGAYAWTPVKAAYEWRLEQTLKASFIAEMTAAIKKLEVKTSKQLVVRIHDSGDFYNKKYLDKWLTIINALPGVKFYAYTKMIPLFKSLQLPENFRVIFSEGGKRDDLIDTKLYHAKVFRTKEELLNAGYVDNNNDDLAAAIGTQNKIGLVYHGAKSKQWETTNE